MAQNTESEKRRIDLDRLVRDRLAKIGFHGTSQQLTNFYNETAKEYNEMSVLANYDTVGCTALVAALGEMVPDKEARILDVAAGSGLAGKELQKAGYTNVDALEPAEKMLKLAKAANIYRNYIIDVISSEKKCDIEDDTYDALTIMGSVLKGHITLEYLPELMRITKKGGVIVFNVSEKYLKSDPQFQDGKHYVVFQRYIDSGEWVAWDERTAPYRCTDTCSIFRITLA